MRVMRIMMDSYENLKIPYPGMLNLYYLYSLIYTDNKENNKQLLLIKQNYGTILFQNDTGRKE
jgi:hypothetical protein